MQVSPQEKLCVAALISNPGDTGTYFVQAVLRDTLVNKILGSVKLTQDPNNTRRFFGYIEAPSNNTPTGRYINVTTSIYTDNAYSVYSLNYEEVVENYIVAQRWSMALAGGAGGADLYAPDYRKIITAVLKDTIEPVFGRINKAISASQKYGKGEKVTQSEQRIIDALRATQRPQKADKEVAALKTAIENLVAKVEAAGTTSSSAETAMRESLSKLSEAAETIMQGMVYHAVTGDEPPLKSVSRSFYTPQDETEPTIADGMKDGDDSGARTPTPGVVPLHLLVPRKRKLAKAGLLRTTT